MVQNSATIAPQCPLAAFRGEGDGLLGNGPKGDPGALRPTY